MLCPQCGKEIAEGKSFCPKCGTKLEAATPSIETQAGNSATSVNQPETKRNRKPLIIGIICAVVTVALIVAGFMFWKIDKDTKAQEDYNRIHSIHAVSLAVSAPSYTPEATRIPVQVQGKDVDGTTVDETQFVDGSGQGLKLMQGSYELSFPASPLLADGSLYKENPSTVAVVLDDVLQSGEAVETKNPVIQYAIEDPLAITDEQITLAHDYAKKDVEQDADGVKAEALTVTATEKRDQAIADKKATDAAAQAAAEAEAAAKKAACHFDAGAFYLDVPESWYGRCTATESGEDRRPSAGGAMIGGKNLYYTFYLDGTPMFVVATYNFNIGGEDRQYWVGDGRTIFKPLEACPAEDISYIRNSLVFTGVNPYAGTT